MIVKPNDIVTENSTVWLSQAFLEANAGVSSGYLRVARHRAEKTGSPSWRSAYINGCYYFDIDNISKSLRARLPEAAELLQLPVAPKVGKTATKTAKAKQPSQPQAFDISFLQHALFETYKNYLPLYANFDRETRTALAQAAAVLHHARQYCEAHGVLFKKSAFFERLAKELETEEVKYLPKSWRNLRDKIREYACGKALCELVRPKNIENKSAVLFAGNDLIKGWLIELAVSQKNVSGGYIFRKIRLLCEQHGIEKQPSLRWVTDCLASPSTKFLINGRYDEGNRHGAHYRGYTPMQTALYAGDCWQIDGTRVNIINHRIVVTDKDGRRKMVNKFLYIIVVRDVMSGLPLAWTYCHEESADAVINTVAHAVRNAGYLPYEMVYDRFPGHKTDEWAWIETGLRNRGVLMTVTSNATGKANVERWFGTLQDVFMAESDYYYGEGIKSTRRHAHRTKEYVQKMRKWAEQNGFDFDAACREATRIIDAYCTTKLNSYSRKFKNIDRSPNELHAESHKPNTTKFQEHEFCYLFGLQKSISIRNYMIHAQIEGVQHYYGIDDCDLAENYTGIKLFACFDWEDLSRVYLFDGDKFLGGFAEIPAVQRYGKDRDMRGVGITKSIAAKMSTHRREKLQEIEGLKNRAMEAITEPETDEITAAVVDEMALLLGGKMTKSDYEAAESAYLINQWGEDEEELEMNVRDFY